MAEGDADRRARREGTNEWDKERWAVRREAWHRALCDRDLVVPQVARTLTLHLVLDCLRRLYGIPERHA